MPFAGAELAVSQVLYSFCWDDFLYMSLVALVSFYISLEVSGCGIVCRFLSRRRLKRLKDDLERVQEWQEQLRVLKAARDKRRFKAAKQQPHRTNTESAVTVPGAWEAPQNSTLPNKWPWQ